MSTSRRLQHLETQLQHLRAENETLKHEARDQERKLTQAFQQIAALTAELEQYRRARQAS